MKNIHTIKVVFGDTDAAGIVFYPNFYRWMDQSAHELVKVVLMPVSRLQKEKKIILPLLETFCQFHSPLFFEDEVNVHSKVVELKDKVFKIEHVFKKKGKIVAEGYEVRAWTSIQSSKPKAVAIPEETKKAFGVILES